MHNIVIDALIFFRLKFFFIEKSKCIQNSLFLIEFLLTRAFANHGSTVNAFLGGPLQPSLVGIATIFFSYSLVGIVTIFFS
jgi:hypothetical protein